LARAGSKTLCVERCEVKARRNGERRRVGEKASDSSLPR
jgi:hypothetical protein